MLQSYTPSAGRLEPDRPGELGTHATWIDLVAPTSEEVASVEAALGIDIPTRAEAREIEASSRLYRENGAYYMTAYVLFRSDTEQPVSTTATFVLAGNRLVSVRYSELRAFPMFANRAATGEETSTAPAEILIGLLEAIIDRTADAIERTQDRVENLAQDIFDARRNSRHYTRRLNVVLRTVGRQGDVTARLEESAFSIERLLTYLGQAMRERGDPPSLLPRLENATRDVRSLTEQMRFLTDRITFLLDATLGAISIEQNQTMKVFTLMAVILMPPTLIAAIYGMNFRHMPELEWIFGYPMALLVMLASAVLPFAYFKWRGWF